MHDLTDSDMLVIRDALKDYARLLEVGMSLAYPIPTDRLEVERRVKRIITLIDPQGGTESGDPTRDTSGPDSAAGRADADGDDAAGDRQLNRGYSGEGIDTADRSDEPAGWEIPDSVGSTEDVGAPLDEQADDPGILPPGE